MADEIKTGPEVAPRGYEPTVGQPFYTPEMFGYGLAKGAEEAAQSVQIVKKQQERAAKSLLSAGYELDFGKALDGVVDQFKGLEGLQPIQQIGDFNAQVEKLRSEAMSKIKDPQIAAKFAMATRVQTQAAYRHMQNHADLQVDKWQEQTVKGQVDLGVMQAGKLMTGKQTADLKTLGEISASVVPSVRALYQSRQMAPALVEAEVQKVESGIINEAMAAYVETPAAGLALLDAKFPGTDTTVRDVLGAKDFAKWYGRFTTRQTEKVGAGLGAQWYLDNPGQDPRAAARKYVDGATDPEDRQQRYAAVTKAMQDFRQMRNDDHAQQVRQEGENYKTGYATVMDKFGGNVEQAINSGALDYLTRIQKDQLRDVVTTRDANDPKYQPGRNLFGDTLTAGIGWSDRWPTEGEFMAFWMPQVGRHRYDAELRPMYEADKRRPKELDARIGSASNLFDTRVRTALDFANDGTPNTKDWTMAEQWQQDMHDWIIRGWNEGVNQHLEAIKSGKQEPPDWDKKLGDAILSKVMNQKGQIKKGVTIPTAAAVPPRPFQLPPHVERAMGLGPVGSVVDGEKVGADAGSQYVVLPGGKLRKLADAKPLTAPTRVGMGDVRQSEAGTTGNPPKGKTIPKGAIWDESEGDFYFPDTEQGYADSDAYYATPEGQAALKRMAAE